MNLFSYLASTTYIVPEVVLTEPSNLIMRLAADDVNNVTEQISVNFASTDVNTTTNRISMAAPGMIRDGEFSAVEVTFTTTGTLPSPLVAGQRYLAEDMADGTFRFFPIVDNDDWNLFSDFENGETIYPNLAYSTQSNIINFTSQGTGTHTMESDSLVTFLNDNTANNLDWQENTNSRKFAMKEDSSSRPYIDLSGSLGTNGETDGYGRRIQPVTNTNGLDALINGQQYYYSVAVLNPTWDRPLHKKRIFLDPTTITIASGNFNSLGHPFNTGDEVRLVLLSDTGALPGGFTGPTAFVRDINANNFTLHATEADATNNVNPLTFTDAGSGVFAIAATSEMRALSNFRQFILDVNTVSGNNHDFTSAIYVVSRQVNFTTTVFTTTNAFNGLIRNVFPSSATGSDAYVYRVRLVIPAGSTPPLRTDTSTPLTSGTYYATRQGSNLRLHQSEVHAITHVNNTNVSTIPNTEVIKYDTSGGISGQFGFVVDNRAMYRQFEDLYDANNGTAYINENELQVLVTLTDFNDLTTNTRFTAGSNAVNNLLDNVDSGTISSNVGNSTSKMHIGNTNEPHVPGKGRLYELFLGVSNTDPTTDIQTIIDYCMRKYNIT